MDHRNPAHCSKNKNDPKCLYRTEKSVDVFVVESFFLCCSLWNDFAGLTFENVASFIENRFSKTSNMIEINAASSEFIDFFYYVLRIICSYKLAAFLVVRLVFAFFLLFFLSLCVSLHISFYKSFRSHGDTEVETRASFQINTQSLRTDFFIGHSVYMVISISI